MRDITQAVDAVIATKDGNVFGFSNVYLEGERAFIRSQETNLGNLSADSGIHVSLVEPGYIATAMTAHRSGRMPGADIVAAAIETCLTRSRRRVVVPGYYRPLIWIANLLPWTVDRRYNGRIG